MTRATDPTEQPNAPRAIRWGAWLAAALISALLGGCTYMSDVFGEEEAPQTRVQTPPEAQGEQLFPNLGTVPDQPPDTTTAQERAEITEGLAADRANAEYTDETLGAQGANAPPAAPPPPASPPAPAAPPEPAAQSPAPEENVETQVETPAKPEAPTAAAASAAAAPPPETTVEPQPAPPPSGQPAAAQPAASSPAAPAAPQTAAVTQPAPTPAPPPPTAPEPQVLEGGSVIVNPDAAAGGGASGANRLLPSGESRPIALVFFRHGSASLSSGDIAVLREVVRLHEERGGLIRVIGHASLGGAAGDNARQNLANFNISLARANAVARELSRLGVPTDQIQVAAAGAQQPLYYETQPTGEAGNRRAEVYLDY